MKRFLLTAVIIAVIVFVVMKCLPDTEETEKEEVYASPVVLDTPSTQSSEQYYGRWAISVESITEYVKSTLVKGGIKESDELYAFFLSDGITTIKNEYLEYSLTLNGDGTCIIHSSGSETEYTYEVGKSRGLTLTNEKGESEYYGDFSSDYSRLNVTGFDGLYLVKEN